MSVSALSADWFYAFRPARLAGVAISVPQTERQVTNRMSIKSAFTTAWKSFKSFVTKADQFLVTAAPKIQSVIVTAEKVAVAAIPALAPEVTIFDTFEEAIMGEITSAFHTGAALTNSTTGETTVTLSAELSAIVKQLADTLAGHPAVVAATATVTAAAAAPVAAVK